MSLARRAFSVCLLAALAGCGFSLRGTTPDSQLAFESVYVDAPNGTPLERDLRNAVRSGGTTLAADPKSAQVLLRVLSQREEKKLMTLNLQGQVREFVLTYRVHFEVADAENKKLLQPPEIALQTIVSYSESQALAKELEERLTYDDLRRDAVSQIMRQLARVNPKQ